MNEKRKDCFRIVKGCMKRQKALATVKPEYWFRLMKKIGNLIGALPSDRLILNATNGHSVCIRRMGAKNTGRLIVQIPIP